VAESVEIELLAFESMGVRSMATIVRTRDVIIAIDPSAALAPRRFGLPPHMLEAKALLEAFRIIEDRVRDCDIVIVTHYHYDHHDPGKFMDLSVLKGKKLVIKNPSARINASQRARAYRFLKLVRGLVSEISVGDGTEISIGRTRITISSPVPHGESPRLGYVLEICIDDGEERMLFTSDIEGAPLPQQIEPFYSCKPRIAVVDGPPTYLAGYKFGTSSLEQSIANLAKVVEEPWLETMVLDHHSARELEFKEKMMPLFEKATKLGKRILLASQFMGREPLLLEARRRDLFKEDPSDGLRILKANTNITDLEEY